VSLQIFGNLGFLKERSRNTISIGSAESSGGRHHTQNLWCMHTMGASIDTFSAVTCSGYLCRGVLQKHRSGAMQLVEDLGLATSSDADDAGSYCEGVAGLQLQSRAAEMRTAQQNCPEPSDPHLQAARQDLDSGLAENTEAGDCLERYCAASGDADWLGEANSHIGKASELGALADHEMQAYYA
jgi:hypothetical protein